MLRSIPQDRKVYLVGGALRDGLLGLIPHDLDFTLHGDVKKVARRTASELGAAFYTLDEERGNFRLIYMPPGGLRSTIDFSRLRGETIEDDLLARDFTINAVALEVTTGQLLDPARGASDLKNHVLRMCSASAFQDDPLRVLRGVRLAPQFDLHIEEITLERMRVGMPALQNVSPERKRDEIFRFLESSKAATSFRLLEMLNGLPILFPELVPLKDTPQTAPHYQDVWNHTLAVIEATTTLINLLAREDIPSDKADLVTAAASARLGRFRSRLAAHFGQEISSGRSSAALLQLAVLYHDAGKPATTTWDEKDRIHNYDHEKISANMIVERAQLMLLSRHEIERLKRIVRYHMRIHSLVASGKKPSRKAIFRFFRDSGDAGVDICLHTLADTLGTYGSSLPQDTWFQYLDVCRDLFEAWWEKKDEQVDPPLLLDGDDLQELFLLKPGPGLGKLLADLRENQACGNIQTREEAIQAVKNMLNSE